MKPYYALSACRFGALGPSFITTTPFGRPVLLLITALLFCGEAMADVDAWAALREGRAVAMIRHAAAPGTGDPPDFNIGDCATQRNLSEAGREQALRIGNLFRSQGISEATIYSSQWCRCLDTARLMDLGLVVEMPALNSFFANRSTEQAQVKDMKAFLAERAWSGPVLWVTHQVNMTALTGIFPQSGEVLIVGLGDEDRITVMHREVVR